MDNTGQVLLDFYKAVIQTVNKIDKSRAKWAEAEGIEGFVSLAQSPLSPAVIAREFCEKAANMQALSKKDIGHQDAAVCVGVAQLSLEEDIIPSLSTAGYDWQNTFPEGESIYAAMERIERDPEEVAATLTLIDQGLSSARDELLLYVVPNTRFALNDMKVAIK